MPEEPSLQPHLKYSITFDILCPISGCDSIKMNGKDHRHSLKSQWFWCKRHRVSFYSYTSWLMVKLTEIVIQRILLALFSGKNTSVQLARQYHISPSVISNLIHHCQDYVDHILSKIKESQEKLKQDQEFTETSLKDIIWLDEIFFKVGGSSFPLIIAINGEYQVVGWKLGKTRKAEDILEVLNKVTKNQPNWSVLIGDGARPYPKALRLLKRDCYLIQHFHSNPWNVAQIHKFEVLSDKKSIKQSIIELQYNVFVSVDPQVGFALEKIHVPKKKGKKGRPKGSKNKKNKKPKKPKKPKKTIPSTKIAKKRRGPKTPRNSGQAFRINNDDTWLGIKWFDEKSSQNSQIPSLELIQELVFLGFAIFKGRSIVSNLIESMNAVVRNSLPDRGLKTETHLSNHVNGVMELNSKTNGELKERSAIPIAKKTGFVNLGQFMKPDIDQIQVLVEIKGMYR